MSTIADDVREARALGLSYGQYKMFYPATKATAAPKRAPRSQRKYTDKQAFALWKEGKSDSTIASELGVSRQSIQHWRDNLELPSTAKKSTNTKKYRLVETQHGTYAIKDEE